MRFLNLERTPGSLEEAGRGAQGVPGHDPHRLAVRPQRVPPGLRLRHGNRGHPESRRVRGLYPRSVPASLDRRRLEFLTRHSRPGGRQHGTCRARLGCDNCSGRDYGPGRCSECACAVQSMSGSREPCCSGSTAPRSSRSTGSSAGASAAASGRRDAHLGHPARIAHDQSQHCLDPRLPAERQRHRSRPGHPPARALFFGYGRFHGPRAPHLDPGASRSEATRGSGFARARQRPSRRTRSSTMLCLLGRSTPRA